MQHEYSVILSVIIKPTILFKIVLYSFVLKSSTCLNFLSQGIKVRLGKIITNITRFGKNIY